MAGSGLAPSQLRVGRGWPLGDAEDRFHHVVDISEIAQWTSAIEHVDRTIFQNRFGKQKQRHVGPAPRSVDREKSQAGARQTKQMRIGVGHQLVGLLAGGVQTQWMIDAVVCGKRQPGVAAVDGARRGVDEVLRPRVAAPLQNVGEADQIAVHIRLGIDQRVANAGLGGQMNHNRRSIGREQLRHRWPLGKAEFDETKSRFAA